MSPRVFISHRTSDGADKATALARELNAIFGDEQIFLDKENLTAGLPWREAIGAALDLKPAAMQPLAERTLRRLRACDWRADVDRRVDDLQALGVQRIAKPVQRRRLQIALACDPAMNGEQAERWLEMAREWR